MKTALLLISFGFLSIFGYWLFLGQNPPSQTLMDVQEIPERGMDIRACSDTSECIPIVESCCDCNQGGKKIAVNRKYYKFVLDQKEDQCLLQSCPKATSTDASCTNQKASCVSGRCQMQ
jgi:hypothetical protein